MVLVHSTKTLHSHKIQKYSLNKFIGMTTLPLLNTYEDKDEAENAASLITGEKRLASERDGTETIYNLFGVASWGNFYKLGMFNLVELQNIVELKNSNQPFDTARHKEIISMLRYAAKSFDLQIPEHWC